jgi:hypothetical protein
MRTVKFTLSDHDIAWGKWTKNNWHTARRTGAYGRGILDGFAGDGIGGSVVGSWGEIGLCRWLRIEPMLDVCEGGNRHDTIWRGHAVEIKSRLTNPCGPFKNRHPVWYMKATDNSGKILLPEKRIFRADFVACVNITYSRDKEGYDVVEGEIMGFCPCALVPKGKENLKASPREDCRHKNFLIYKHMLRDIWELRRIARKKPQATLFPMEGEEWE